LIFGLRTLIVLAAKPAESLRATTGQAGDTAHQIKCRKHVNETEHIAHPVPLTSLLRFANTARSMAEPKENPLMERSCRSANGGASSFNPRKSTAASTAFGLRPARAELKRNVKDLWWRTMVHNREDVVGLEATIIMHPQIWQASGHVDTFSDPMCDCLLTKKRFRADQVQPRSGILFQFAGAIAKDFIEQFNSSQDVKVDLSSSKPFGNYAMMFTGGKSKSR